MRSTQDILALLDGFMPYAENRYGIKRIGVFGSVARGEQNDDSDVDICYEGRALSFLTMDLFQSELEKLLGCKVDTVREHILKYILILILVLNNFNIFNQC